MKCKGVFLFVLFLATLINAEAQVKPAPKPVPQSPPPPPPPPPPVPSASMPESAASPQQTNYRKVVNEYSTVMNFLGSGSLFQNNADADFAVAVAVSISQLQSLVDYEKAWGTKDSLQQLTNKLALKETLSELEKWKPKEGKATNDTFTVVAENLIKATLAENEKYNKEELSLSKQMINQAKLVSDLSKEYLKSGTDPVLVSFAKKAIEETKPLVQ